MKGPQYRPLVVVMISRFCVHCFEDALKEDEFFHPFEFLASEYPVYALRGLGYEAMCANMMSLASGKKVSRKETLSKNSFDSVLSRKMSEAGVRQYYIGTQFAFPEITYFFSGKNTSPSETMSWDFVASNGDISVDVKTISKKVISHLRDQKDRFIFAHMFDAVNLLKQNGGEYISSVRAIESALKKITNAVLHNNGVLLVISDFSKGDENALFPALLVANEVRGRSLNNGPDAIANHFSLLQSSGSIFRIPSTIFSFLGIDEKSEESPLYAFHKNSQQVDPTFGKPFEYTQ